MSQSDEDYGRLVAKLPQWVLFFNLGAYKYLPEMRMQGQIEDTRELLQRLGLQTAQSLGGVGAGQFLEAIRRPSDEPYWKLRGHGGCQDIFFLTTYAKIPGLIKVMSEAAEAVGYPADKMGIYLQPIVQGSSCHVEFNLFYDPTDKTETCAVRSLATSAIQPLMSAGAFFSRPFGEAARDIMNRDAASVEALEEVQGDRRPGRHPQSGQTMLLREGTRTMALEDYRAEMESCCRCSACKFIPLEKVTGYEHANACPSISRYNFHSYSGGGRMGFGLGLLRGRVEYTPKVAEVVYNCNLCGACDISCKYAMEMDVLEPLYAIRQECVKNGQTVPVWDKLVQTMQKQGPMVLGAKGKRDQWYKGLDVKDYTQKKVPVVYHAGCLANYDEAAGKRGPSRPLLAQESGSGRGHRQGPRAVLRGPGLRDGLPG